MRLIASVCGNGRLYTRQTRGKWGWWPITSLLLRFEHWVQFIHKKKTACSLSTRHQWSRIRLCGLPLQKTKRKLRVVNSAGLMKPQCRWLDPPQWSQRELSLECLRAEGYLPCNRWVSRPCVDCLWCMLWVCQGCALTREEEGIQLIPSASREWVGRWLEWLFGWIFLDWLSIQPHCVYLHFSPCRPSYHGHRDDAQVRLKRWRNWVLEESVHKVQAKVWIAFLCLCQFLHWEWEYGNNCGNLINSIHSTTDWLTCF